MKFRVFDYAAFLVAAAALVFVFVYAAGGQGDSLQVHIEGSGNEWVYPLSKPAEIHVPGPLGDTIVVIADGKVGVTESPCREKLCIASSPIFRPGTWVACLPNRVFVRIEGTDAEEIDAGTF